MSKTWAIVACLLAGGIGLLERHPLWGADPAEALPPLRFVRAFVPQGHEELWPRSTEKMVPVKRAEFERLVRLAESATNAGPNRATTRIESAEYAWQAVNAGALEGTLTLKIVHEGGPARLPLDPCELALANPRWDDNQPAALAVDETGRLSTFVERAGRLMFDVSLKGRKDAEDAFGFTVMGPSVLTSRATIQLPMGRTLRVDQGLVRTEAADVGETGTRCIVEMAGALRGQWKVVPATDGQQPRPLALLRENSVYSFSPRGVELSAQLRLDVHQEPLQQLAVTLPGPLRFIAAKYADQLLPCVVTKAKSGGSRVVIDLSDHLPAGTNRVVTVTAIAPFSTVKAPLPRVQVEGVFWQTGSATLLLPTPMELQDLEVQGGRQVKAGVLPPPTGGDTAELQWFSSQGSAVLRVGRKSNDWEVAAGTELTISGAELLGQTVLDLRPTLTEQFDFTAETPRHWLIEAVETIPAGGIEDWTVSSTDAPWQRLTVRFSKPARPQRPIKLLLQGRWRRVPGDQTWPWSDLNMVRLFGGSLVEHLIELKTAGSIELKLSDADSLERIDAKRLTAEQEGLFTGPVTGPLFSDDKTSLRGKISVSTKASRYDAQLRLTTQVTGAEIQDTYVVRCLPKTAAVDNFLVLFSTAHAGTIQWRSLTPGVEIASTRRWSREELRGAGWRDSADIWELTLTQERSGAFELEARGAAPREREMPLILASLPGAETQQGRVTVEASAGTSLWIDNRRLKGLPTGAELGGTHGVVRWQGRFEPADAQSNEPAIVVQTTPGSDGPERTGGWVWRERYDARVAPNGLATHTVTYFIENSGAASFTLSLPNGAELGGIRRGGKSLLFETNRDGQRISIPLNATERFVIVTLDYVTRESGWSLWGFPTARIPKCDWPILDPRVTMWLPSSFEAGGRSGEDLTISQRLFGPLGRGARDIRFDPWRESAWQSLAGRIQGATRHDPVLSSWLNEFAAAARRGEGVATWGEVMQRFQAAVSESGRRAPTILIDAEALAEEGIFASTVWDTRGSTDDLGFAVTALNRAGLTWLLSDDVAVLTSVIAALDPEIHAQLRLQGAAGWLESGKVEASPPGPGEPNSELPATDRRKTYLGVKPWLALPEFATGPWRRLSAAAADFPSVLAWTPRRLTTTGTEPPSLWCLHSRAREAVSWSLFLCTAALAVLLHSGRRGGRAMWAGAALLGALLSPALVAPFFTAALWGMVAGWLLRWALRFKPARERGPQFVSEQSATTMTVVTAGVSGLLIGFVVVHSAWAAEGTNSSPSELGPIYRVLIPVDAERRPAGEDVYVPEEFYRGLLRREQSRSVETGSAREWWVEHAAYTGMFVRENPAGAPQIADLKSTYRFRTAKADTRVRWPWGGDESQLLPDTLLLDQVAVPLRREANGEISLDVPTAGVHQLELHWRPAPRIGSRDAGFDLWVPAAGTAELTLTGTAEVGNLRAISARGSSTWDQVSGRLSVALGSANRLQVRWTDIAGRAEAEPVVLAEELVWMRVLPGAVVLDLKYKLTVKEGRLREFRLTTDSRLRLLPGVANEQVTVTAGEPAAGQAATVQFQFTRPITTSATVEATMLLTGASGSGSLRLPTWEVSGRPPTSRWLGVSIDPALQWEEHATAATPALPVGEFGAAWGSGESRPAIARRLSAGEPDWSLSVRPLEPKLTAQETVFWIVETDRARLVYAAELSISGGYRFQYRVNAPANLHVDSIVLREDDSDRPVRFAREENGELIVFLPESPSGPQRLLLQATVPAPTGGDWELPRVQIQGASITNSRCTLLRRPEILITKSGVTGLKPEPAPEAWLADAVQKGILEKELVEKVRVDTAWAGSDPDWGGRVTLAANPAQFSAIQLTSLEHDDEGWQATVIAPLTIQSGQLDVIRFDVPATWSGPFTLSPPGRVTVMEGLEKDRRILAIRPRVALTGNPTLTIRGQYQVPDGVRLPDVNLLGATVKQRFVALPTLVNLQLLAWELRNLSPTAWPEEIRGTLTVNPSAQVYRVEGERGGAALKTAETLAGSPRVSLADYHVTITESGRLHGLARFVVQPAGSGTCDLTLPRGCELLQLKVADTPAIYRRESELSYRVLLGLTDWPVLIEALYRDESSMATGELRGPTLGNLAVDASVWEITAAGRQPIEVSAVNELTTATAVAAQRLDKILPIVETAGRERAAVSVEDVARWAAPWMRQLHAGFAQADAARSAGGQALDNDWLQRQQRWTKLKSSYPQAASPARESAESPPPGSPTLYAAFDSGVSGLRFAIVPATRGDLWPRLLLVVALGGAAAGGVWLWSRGLIQEVVVRYPLAFIVAAGYAWWLWLDFSMFGLLLIGGGLYWTVRLWRRSLRPVSARRGL